MKRSTAVIAAAATALIVATAVAVPTFAHGPGGGGGYGGWGMGGHGPGMMGPGYGGRHGSGYGGHHGPGWGMGGGGHGPGMMGYGPGGDGAPCADPAAAEARLKVIEERLKLTDAQKPAFEAFAKTMRESFESIQKKHQGMDPETMHGLSHEDRLAYMENFRADRLEAMNAVREARDELLGVLDDKQKSTARALLPGRFKRF